MNDLVINTAFPESSNYVDVLGSKMHYVEQGSGDTILFLHGIPTSSYLWRNILPQLSDAHQCIAVDLIGLGKSDKPDIEYTVFDHIKYIEGFIDALSLSNITLVAHAWGSVIGFDIAMRRPELFKGLAFVESQVRPVVDSSMLSLPMHELTALLKDNEETKKLLKDSTYYIDKILPAGVLRSLTEEELSHYREPFLESGSGQPIWQFLHDLPKGEQRSNVLELIENYSQKLQQSDLPKLMMYAVPGFNTTMSTVAWAKENLPNLTLTDIGEGLHYPQESNPKAIGDALRDWLQA